MTRARDIMSGGAEHLSSDDTVSDAAKRLAEDGVGAMPVGNDHAPARRHGHQPGSGGNGAGRRPGPVGPEGHRLVRPTRGRPIGADDDVELAIQTMNDHQVRRLPVIDGDQLVACSAQADIARHCPADMVGDLVAGISD